MYILLGSVKYNANSEVKQTKNDEKLLVDLKLKLLQFVLTVICFFPDNSTYTVNNITYSARAAPVVV